MGVLSKPDIGTIDARQSWGRSTAEWANSRNRYQAFSVSHGLDKSPSETVVLLGILVTTNCFVSTETPYPSPT